MYILKRASKTKIYKLHNVCYFLNLIYKRYRIECKFYINSSYSLEIGGVVKMNGIDLIIFLYFIQKLLFFKKGNRHIQIRTLFIKYFLYCSIHNFYVL